MMKVEFDNLIGFKTDYDSYRKIEDVYNRIDAIKDKYHIARIYKKYDMNGIESLAETLEGIASADRMEFASRVLRA